MNNFPDLSRGSGVQGFTEVRGANAVQVASMASGLPVRNKLFTFVPKIFKHTKYLVTQANKETSDAFYLANCDVPFNWTNDNDATSYVVVFDNPPQCSLDKIKERWRIQYTFTQFSP